MDIKLSGKLYVHFIKSVFESNQKIGIEFIIDKLKSDNQLIDGLMRLKLLNNNKFFVNNKYIKNPVKLYDKKYLCNIFITIHDNKQIILENITDVEYDKINKIVDNKLFIPNYSVGKNKTAEKIMDIIAKM
jgi:hypothetical protein